MAGVGKTALAVHWAHRIADRYPDGQLYVNLRGFEADAAAVDPAEAVWWFLEALGVSGPAIPTGLDARTALYRSVLADRRCLIVLDNARDAAQVLPLLPGTAHCLVLITSRGRLPRLVSVTGARAVTLDVLTDSEAEEFLIRRLGLRRVTAEPDAARELIALCARLPLALAIICTRAAYHPAFRLTAVAAELRQAQGGLDAFSDTDGAADVRAVLSWSYRALPGPAARLFRLLALHLGTDVTVPAAASLVGATIAETRALFGLLTGASLSVEHQPGRYHRHDLVGAYATELLDSHDAADQRKAALHRMLDHHLHTAYAGAYQMNRHRDFMTPAAPVAGVHPQPFAGYQDALAWFTVEHSTLLKLIDFAIDGDFPDHAWQLAWCMLRYLDWQGHWGDFTASQHAGLRAARLSGSQTGMGYAHRGISRVEYNDGRLEESLRHLDQALALFEQQGDTLAMAYTCRQDAGIRTMVGDHDKALANGRRALALFRAAGERAGEAGALVACARVLNDLGRYQEALSYSGQAIAIYEETGADHGRATALDSLGVAYYALGRYEDAIRTHLLAVEDHRTLGGPRAVPGSLLDLALAYQAAGRHEEAVAAQREAETLLKARRRDQVRLSPAVRAAVSRSSSPRPHCLPRWGSVPGVPPDQCPAGSHPRIAPCCRFVPRDPGSNVSFAAVSSKA
jgi:tetratricopeptide (TPR) repeat protein